MTVVRAEEVFPPEPVSASRARRFVRTCLVGRASDERIDAAVLLVSELVTNAVVHTGSAVGVAVLVDGGSVRVEVTDGGPGVPTVRADAGLDECGRGMAIVDRLAPDWGVTPLRPGKKIWFVVDGSEPP